MPHVLPFVYVGVAIANVLATLAFDSAQSRVSRTHSIVGTQIVLGVTVLLARQLVEAHSRTVYFVLVIWLEACALLSITLFFSFAGDYFNPRDARRLYGFIAGGMPLGTVLSGYASRVSVVADTGASAPKIQRNARRHAARPSARRDRSGLKCWRAPRPKR